VTVEASLRYIGCRWLVGPPKTPAGVRTVILPAFVATALAAHVHSRIPPLEKSVVFGTASGKYLSGANTGLPSGGP